MAYTRTRLNVDEVEWNTDTPEGCPTLSRIIEAAKTEFPDVPFEELIVDASGYDAELVQLKRKSS